MATFTLRKQFRFEASHQLPHHDGKCKRLHGHSWGGTVIVEGEQLNMKGSKQGMLIDYSDISTAVKGMVEEYLDHHHLNDSVPGMSNPTSENIAKWCFDYLDKRLPMLAAVQIDETCTASCVYRPTK
jgi:6-pyruvoyltetrahydropterin/6-carboxytetrahydropterin synthase